MPLVIDKEKCVGCGVCEEHCPFNSITIADRTAIVDENTCTLCGACAKQGVCPFHAIELVRRERRSNVNLDDYSNIWVFAEQKKGVIQGVSYELLAKAQELAQQRKQEVWALLIGKNVAFNADELIARGADKVLIIEDDSLEAFEDGTYANVITRLCKKYKPEAVLCGATSIGRALIPRVAVQLKTGLTADCTELHIDKESGCLVQTRPAFGGNIMASILCPDHRPQMSTVRHKVFEEAVADASRTGEVISENLLPEDIFKGIRVIEVVEDEGETVNIAEANFIVSGGRALKNPENFKLIEDLAKVLDGAVGASRAAVDEGWIPYSHQVGQTGQTVNPTIYIACGISGQIQHLVGMQSADVIIAINKDLDAPIMKLATYAIEGDLFEVIPEIIKQVNK